APYTGRARIMPGSKYEVGSFTVTPHCYQNILYFRAGLRAKSWYHFSTSGELQLRKNKEHPYFNQAKDCPTHFLQKGQRPFKPDQNQRDEKK
ncbi:MAG: hypothetical protein ACPLQP_08245, partial [Moorellaceae bacterium]